MRWSPRLLCFRGIGAVADTFCSPVYCGGAAVHSLDCRGISPDCRRPELLDNELRRPAGVRPRPLLACVTQCCFQALLELFPVFLLRVSTTLHNRKLPVYGGRRVVLITLRLF